MAPPDMPPEMMTSGAGVAGLVASLALLGDRIVRAIKEGQKTVTVADVSDTVKALESRIDALERGGALHAADVVSLKERCQEIRAAVEAETSARSAQHRDYARTLDALKDRLRDLHVAIASRAGGS